MYLVVSIFYCWSNYFIPFHFLDNPFFSLFDCTVIFTNIIIYLNSFENILSRSYLFRCGLNQYFSFMRCLKYSFRICFVFHVRQLQKQWKTVRHSLNGPSGENYFCFSDETTDAVLALCSTQYFHQNYGHISCLPTHVDLS